MTDVAGLLATKFIARQDVFAKQDAKGDWRPVTSNGDYVPWKMKHLRAHVAGEASYGHYLLDTDDQCKVIAFDIDLVPGWPDPDQPPASPPVFPPVLIAGEYVNPRAAWKEAMQCNVKDDVVLSLMVQLYSSALDLAVRMRDRLGIPVAVAYSGNKGFHVYGFTGLKPAAKLRKAALLILKDSGQWKPFKGDVFFKWVGVEHSAISVEVFPKQDSLNGKKLGNLLRLPLGVHGKSDLPAFFLDCQADWDNLYPADPAVVLTEGALLP
jgi:hypothetical protein